MVICCNKISLNNHSFQEAVQILSKMSDISTKLEKHFRSKVDVKQVLKNEADRIYNLVKSEVRNYISQYKNDAVTVVDMGSSSDGLKVVAPDEYDVMLVVENTRLEPSESSAVPGYYTLHTPFVMPESAYRYRWIDLEECVVGERLKPSLVRQSFHSMMQTVVNGHSDSRYSLHICQSGPAIEVGVSWSTSKFMTIDFVPAVKINGEFFVARPLQYDVELGAHSVQDENFLWRKSYIQQEKQKISYFSENLRRAVMLWKAAQLHSAQLHLLSSYHFKTIGMMLASTTRWYSLEECVVAVGEKLISALRYKNLPNFFDAGVNLLHRKKMDSLDNLKNHLTRNLEGDRLLKLLGAHVRESLYVKQNVHVKESGGWCTSCCYCFCMFIMIVIAIVMIDIYHKQMKSYI